MRRGRHPARPAPRARRGSLYIEILVAVFLFFLMLLPLIAGFGTGVQQTRLIKSHSSARYLAEWALAQARSEVAEGGFEERASDGLNSCAQIAAAHTDVDLSAEAAALFPTVAAQLGGLVFTRSVSCAALAGGDRDTRIYKISVRVAWNDPKQRRTKELRLSTIEGEEI